MTAAAITVTIDANMGTCTETDHGGGRDPSSNVGRKTR
jgi:hypothetical protein